jgi:hypothetical protein
MRTRVRGISFSSSTCLHAHPPALSRAHVHAVYPRINGKRAPTEMHEASGTVLNKSPALIDHGPADQPFEKPVTVWESGAIIM